MNDDENECLNKSERAKDLVHKCPSDPGKILAERNNAKQSRAAFQNPANLQPSTSATTRKCVLTLDGYSYVIGKN